VKRSCVLLLAMAAALPVGAADDVERLALGSNRDEAAGMGSFGGR
jgi:hypothetical protein